MIGEIAHALNNPLSAIVLAAGLLRDDPAGPDVTEIVEAIEHEAVRAGRIVAEVRVERREVTIGPADIDAIAPPRSVVLIDDNRALTSMLTTLLERRGWVVSATDDPSAAAALIASVCPSVVLVDLHLDNVSGLDLVASLEAANPGLRGRCAFVTGDRSVDLGGYDVLYKPFRSTDVEALLTRVTEAPASGRDGRGGADPSPT